LNLLSSLSDKAALAVERAQVVSDLERRVQEMNALIRVAQGINITLRFDDILELIFAQTNRIIPTKDFWVLLYDAFGDVFHYAFYLENDRRLLQHENHPLMGEQDLAQIVIRTGQPIVSDDFERESRGRGIIPQVQGLYAWVGVPLNAGASTIGAISLGGRDPSVMFSSDQVDLFQAIADQAAGAIVKARLLEDSERSAKQLTLLNDVARNLTSTLDLNHLLNQILENAVEIIGCEAGTLFLVDGDTGELIFEVVKGPVAEELQGKRLPARTGHVGRSVETGLPAIVNEARHTQEWSRKPDDQTGFKTRDLLLVPMYSKNRVIGVIEVINRKDGLPFTQENQDLLTAFTSQAAIALENARLYTMTDQQLAERVDELSVMQRIDRELNASLDISRAMRITLDWAMRRSGADAGLVGAVLEDGVQVMADQGYADELDPYRESLFPIELPGLKTAIESEQTQQFSRSQMSLAASNGFGLLENAQRQVVIPIRREDHVIGILMLESRRDDPWAEGAQDFLSRLSDHAAIAISNAQLFKRVQEADTAKSEFVSFVSHELKTPMTSIRGYTDLLIGGAVGSINDAQENFLGTIRSNVIRMATLVSDLADVSRIEAGRLKLEFRAVEIRDIVEEVTRSLDHDIKEKGQTIQVEIPGDLPSVWGDRVRIIQVATNLLSNAHKYTPQGGIITIKAERANNKWDPTGPSEVVRVSVEDTGIGLTPEDQEQIFTKFFRSSDPKAREAPGTGLGLNITKYLVEMQGGKIWFESEYEKGTAFQFTIPIAEV
jgi:signal transduction histidine kinase